MKTFTSIIVLLLSHVNGYTLNYIELFANKVTPIALEVDAGLGMDTLTFTIEECVNAAVEQSGLAGFDQNFSEIASLHKQIADSYKLPVLQLSGQYTYQSEVVSLPDNPVFSTPEIPKNQGKVYLEAQQVLYNGKRATKSGALEQGNVEIQKKEWERDMEQLEDAVRELYYALLLSRKQVDILGRTAEETSRQREIVAVWVENGIKSAIDLYKFDLLLLQQKRTISESRSRVKQLSVQMEGITGLDITGAKLQEPKNVWPDKP
ncbi:MAG: TolC family protein, partial [Cyclobacteriaceae bacterium]|nr:TolC family protein [Cyclobacteriaceae bacterium]